MAANGLLARLRDEVYECYIRSGTRSINYSVSIRIGERIAPGLHGGDDDSPFGSHTAIHSLHTHAISNHWRGLVAGDCCPIIQAFSYPSGPDKRWDFVEVEEEAVQENRSYYRRLRDVPLQYDISMSSAFHSNRRYCPELCRFIQQSGAILDLVWHRFPRVQRWPWTGTLDKRGFKWPFLCIVTAWERPDIISYGITTSNLIDLKTPIPLGMDLTSFVGHPLSDRASFEAWKRGRLNLPPGDYTCSLSRDVRACTVSALDRLLASDETPAIPYWSPGDRTLRFGGVVCRSYSRAATNQFQLLESFQSQEWPRSIRDPWGRTETLIQTVKDLNKGMTEESRIVFGVENFRATWAEKNAELRA